MEKHNKKISVKEKNNKDNRKNKEKFNFKKYMKDFLLFVDKYLMKSIKILFVIAILLTAISLSGMVAGAKAAECEGACIDGITIWTNYIAKFQILLFTLVAGIVPYIYVGVLGFLGYLLSEVADIAFLIKGYGYFGGIAAGVVPFIINILIISIVTSLAIYICKTVTVSYKISSINNMNFTNFKIRLYEVLNKQDKVDALIKKKDEKIQKLQSRKEKLKYLQILNVSIVVVILQMVSVLIQHLLT